jgi:hypothetical protein
MAYDPASMRLRALAVLLAFSTPLLAQTRPLLTEPAQTAPAGSIVLETGLDFVSAEPNFVTGLTRDRIDGPLLRLVFSPADNVEIDVEWVAAAIALDDPVFGSVSDAGDVTLRAKARLLKERPGRPALAARFAVALPETKASQGLGPNTLRMLAQLLVSRRAGRCALHGNAGLAIQDKVQQGASQVDFFAYGAALACRASPRLELMGEVAGRSGPSEPGAESRAEARLGVRIDRGRVAWDAALRRGLAAADGAWGFTVGLAWTLRRPAPAQP